jgi:hypothetical protein
LSEPAHAADAVVRPLAVARCDLDLPKRFEPTAITVNATGEVDVLHTVVRSTDRYGYCTSLAVYFDPDTTVFDPLSNPTTVIDWDDAAEA